MMKRTKRFNPKYILWISIILALLMVTSSLLIIRRIESSFLEILEKEGYALLESLIISSGNSIKATNVAQQILEDRLLDNAKAIDQMGKLSRARLLTFTSETHLERVDVFSKDGKLQLSSAIYIPGDEKPPSALQFIFSEKTRIMSFKTEEGDFAVAIRRLSSKDIIVCYSLAKYINEFKKSIGIGNLIQKISKESGIEYVLLQNEDGIVFATKNIEKMKKISKDEFLRSALLSNSKSSREFVFEGRKVLEVVGPFSIDNSPYGIFRLGLSLEDYNSVLHDTKRHIVIVSLFIFLIGFIVISFIITNQNYKLLNESFGKMESFTRKVMDGINSAILSVDEDLIITFSNKMAGEIFSFGERNLIGKNYKLLFPSDELMVERSLSANANIDEIEKQYTLPSGKLLHLGIVTSLITDENGRAKGVTALIRDLTLLRKLKDEVQEKERLKALGDLASGVAHEIRNPLNALRLSFERLKQEQGKGNDKLLDIITEEIARIEKTVEDFLIFTKPFISRPKPVNINHILGETLSLLEGKAIKNGVLIKKVFHVIPDVDGDEDALRKVFMNVLRNGIDAMENGGEIFVKTFESKMGVEIRIMDTGVGIPKDEATRIFDPYFSKKKGGTGLGLSIAKRIVEVHKGQISVNSELEKGTEIIILFPIAGKE